MRIKTCFVPVMVSLLLSLPLAALSGETRFPEKSQPMYPFAKGVQQVGFSMGAGKGVEVLGSEEEHDLLLAYLHYGRVISDLKGEGKWYSGHWEGVLELFGGSQIEPDSRYVTGIASLIRYNFLADGPVTWFADLGGGFGFTEINGCDLSGNFQFTIQTAVGVHWFYNNQTALTARIKGFHLSNASTDSPNNGLNTVCFMVGISRFF